MQTFIFLSRDRTSRHLFRIEVCVQAPEADVFANGAVAYLSDAIHGEAAVQLELQRMVALLKALGHTVNGPQLTAEVAELPA